MNVPAVKTTDESAAKADGRRVKTPVFRVSFPHIFEPHAFEENKPRYSIVMIWNKSDKAKLDELQKACLAAACEKWGNDSKKWPRGLKMPFRDGAEKEDLEGYGPNVIFATASSESRPGVVDQKVRPITAGDNSLYAGCYAQAYVRPFAYDKAGNRGVSIGLGNVQKVRDGESFNGQRSPEEDFSPLPDDESATGIDALGGESVTDLW